MKRLIIILIVISAAALSMQVSGLNIKTDGFANENAWLDAPAQVLVSSAGDSNNAVSFAVASVIYDEDSQRVYLSVKANVTTRVYSPGETILEESDGDATELCECLHGLRISVDNNTFVGISHNGTGEYNEVFYFIDAAVSEYNSSAFGVEVCLGVKKGLHTLEGIRVQLVDPDGIPSNVYEIDLPPLPSEETTSSNIVELTASSPPCTTENNTTCISMTRTTTERTTKEKRATAEKTTKEKTTKTKTTKQKTTVKVVTVYVTVPQLAQTTGSEYYAEENSTVEGENSEDYKELKYAAAIGLLVLIFGLCVIINMLNDKNKSNKSTK